MGVVSSVFNSLCSKLLTRTSSDTLKKRGLLHLRSSTSFLENGSSSCHNLCFPWVFLLVLRLAAVGWGQESPLPPQAPFCLRVPEGRGSEAERSPKLSCCRPRPACLSCSFLCRNVALPCPKIFLARELTCERKEGHNPELPHAFSGFS